MGNETEGFLGKYFLFVVGPLRNSYWAWIFGPVLKKGNLRLNMIWFNGVIVIKHFKVVFNLVVML